MVTKSFSVKLPLNTQSIILDVELHIPVIDGNSEKIIAIKSKALVDTGANSSCISKRLASACQLRPVSALKMISAHGMSIAQVYEVSISLPNDIVFPTLSVVEVEGSRSFDVIIGMDILSKSDFAFSANNSDSCFSMRLPSKNELIDFTEL